jgi:hypothetical protein
MQARAAYRRPGFFGRWELRLTTQDTGDTEEFTFATTEDTGGINLCNTGPEILRNGDKLVTSREYRRASMRGLAGPGV